MCLKDLIQDPSPALPTMEEVDAADKMIVFFSFGIFGI